MICKTIININCFSQAKEKKYRILLGFRGRIEYLQKIFDANNLLNGVKCSREDIWLTIMDKGRHRLLNDLKIKIHNAGLKIEEFCQAIGIIYGDTSDRAAHNVVLPKEIKDTQLSEVLELLDIECDESIEATLNILKQKLKLVDDKDVPAELNSSSDSNVSFKSSPKLTDTSKSDDENQAKTVS